MAVWQWDLWLVPKSEVFKRFTTSPQYVDLEWFESIQWWNKIPIEKLIQNIEVCLGKFLPRVSNFTDQNTICWGEFDKSLLRLIIEDGELTDLFIRLDVRNLNKLFLDCLMYLTKKEDFLFFTLESNKFFEPEIQVFLENLKDSKAILFVKNPEDFFANRKYLDKINKENRSKLK